MASLELCEVPGHRTDSDEPPQVAVMYHKAVSSVRGMSKGAQEPRRNDRSGELRNVPCM